jgi:NADPH2:quinone reductase
MTAEVAAGIPTSSTPPATAVRVRPPQAGETVLVQAGASGVGLAAVQLAKAAGATVIATASDDGR